VNQPLAGAELDSFRPSGNAADLSVEELQKRTAKRPELESTMRPRGRPRKDSPTWHYRKARSVQSVVSMICATSQRKQNTSERAFEYSVLTHSLARRAGG